MGLIDLETLVDQITSLIPMTALRKAKLALFIAAAGLLIAGGFWGLDYARQLSREDKWPDEPKVSAYNWPDQSEETEAKYANTLAPPKYQLISDGDNLYLGYNIYKFDLFKGKANPVHVESNGNSVVTLYVEQKQIAQIPGDAVIASSWSDKYQSFCFVTCDFDDRIADYTGKDDRTRLWRWDRKNGLKKVLDWKGLMLAMDGSPREMRSAVDGEYVAFQFRKRSTTEDSGKSEVIVYSLGQSKIRRFPIDEKRTGYFNMDHCTLIDSHTLVEAGPKAMGIDLQDGQRRPLPTLDGMFPMVAYHGQIWALHFINGKYDIIRVNPTLDKIEQTVEIPAKFPKPLRPPDYEDGGD